ncbi:MAG TPA: SRPBCC family protein [Acidimicrobiales bacterium]|nr:SRPBCC family protein [Acidimicrobiales bacterium]
MATYDFSFTVPRPAADVFEYLSRFSNATQWDPGVVSAEDLTAGPVRVGSRFSLAVRFAGRQVPLVYEVSELRPGVKVVFEAHNAMVKSRDAIEVTDLGEPGADECRIRYLARLSGRGPWVIPLSPLLSLALRRAGDKARAGLMARLGAPVRDGGRVPMPGRPSAS